MTMAVGRKFEASIFFLLRLLGQRALHIINTDFPNGYASGTI